MGHQESQVSDLRRISEEEAREVLSEYIVYRFDKACEGYDTIDRNGNPRAPSWDFAVRTEVKGVTKKEAVRKIRLLYGDEKNLEEKKRAFGPLICEQLDATLDHLTKHELDPNYRYELVQVEQHLKELDRYTVDMMRAQRSDRERRVSFRRESSSSRAKRSKPKYERVSITAYFKRSPRSDVKATEMLDYIRRADEHRRMQIATQNQQPFMLSNQPTPQNNMQHPPHPGPPPPPPPLHHQPPSGNQGPKKDGKAPKGGDKGGDKGQGKPKHPQDNVKSVTKKPNMPKTIKAIKIKGKSTSKSSLSSDDQYHSDFSDSYGGTSDTGRTSLDDSSHCSPCCHRRSHGKLHYHNHDYPEQYGIDGSRQHMRELPMNEPRYLPPAVPLAPLQSPRASGVDINELEQRAYNAGFREAAVLSKMEPREYDEPIPLRRVDRYGSLSSGVNFVSPREIARQQRWEEEVELEHLRLDDRLRQEEQMRRNEEIDTQLYEEEVRRRERARRHEQRILEEEEYRDHLRGIPPRRRFSMNY
jgi:hypothetical protein